MQWMISMISTMILFPKYPFTTKYQHPKGFFQLKMQGGKRDLTQMKLIKTENANILEVAHGSKSRAPNNCDVPEWRCFMHKPLSYTHSRADMKHELFYASGNLLHENYSIICFHHNSSSPEA